MSATILKLILICASFTTCKAIMASALHPVMPSKRHFTTSCLEQIIDQSYNTGILTLTSTKNLSFSPNIIENQLIKWVHNQSKWTVHIIGDDINDYSEMLITVPPGYPGINYKNLHRKTDYYIIIFDTIEIFGAKLKQIVTSKSFNNKALFTVLYSYWEFDYEKQAEFVLNLMWQYQIFNSILLINQQSVITNIYTLFPYAPAKQCGKTPKLFLIDKCEYGNRTSQHQLFPNKIPSDLNNCTLNVIAIKSPPFVISVHNKTGVELNILSLIGVKLNVSFNYTIGDKADYYAGRNNASEWLGVQKFIQDNFGIGAGNMRASGEIYEDFEVTSTYDFEYLRWISPKANPAPRWKCLIIIFNQKIWLSFLTVYLTCTIFFYVISHLTFMKIEIKSFRNFGLSFLNSLGVIIGVSLYKHPKTNALRFIFVLTALYGMIVTSLYQSALINVLTNPIFETQIKTQEEILDSGLKIGGIPPYRFIFDDDHTRHIYNSFTINTSYANRNVYDWLVRVASVKDTCTVSNRFYVLFAQASGDKRLSNDKGQVQLYITQKNVMAYPVHMITVKGFPLFDEFNSVIKQVSTGGLMVKWIGEISHMLNRRTQSFSDDGNDDIMLTVAHLEGAFVVVIFGNILAVVTFLLELIINKLIHTPCCIRVYNRCLGYVKNGGKKETVVPTIPRRKTK